VIKFIIFSLLSLISKFKLKNIQNNDELVIILPDKSEGWILEAIANKIKIHTKKKVCITTKFNFNKKSKVILMHYSLLRKYYINGYSLKNASVFFTHERSDLNNNSFEFSYYFNRINILYLMNSSSRKIPLIKKYTHKTLVCVGGFETEIFNLSNLNEGNNVCFVSRFYERKNPNLIKQIVLNNPQYNFYLIGDKWEQYLGFNELLRLSNFYYVNEEYSKYPNIYKKMSYFISVSFNEGGPIPLIETMSCGIYPIVSNTGFAGDVITKENGSVVDIKNKDVVYEISNILESASINRINISESVKKYSWKNFTKKIIKQINFE